MDKQTEQFVFIGILLLVGYTLYTKATASAAAATAAANASASSASNYSSLIGAGADLLDDFGD